MDAKPLKTASKGSGSTITNKATVAHNVQGRKICRTFYVSNIRDWDAILGQPFLSTPNVIMDVMNNKVSIQPIGKLRQQLYMLPKQSNAVCTAACSIYDYDDDICYDSSSHVPQTETEDEKAEFATNHDGSAAHIQPCMYVLYESQSGSTNVAQVISDEVKIFTESPSDSDSNLSTPEEQEYERIFTESDIYSWLACDSAEEMIAQAQPQYVTL